MQTARTTDANASLHKCKAVRLTNANCVHSSMSLCHQFSANCSRLRCKTGCSTDARLSNVVHCIVSLQFAIQLRFSSFFYCVVTPMLCLGPLTLCRTPWALLPPLARVAAPPARSSARCRAACPHVGHGPQPTLEAPREGLRQGDVGGGLDGS